MSATTPTSFDLILMYASNRGGMGFHPADMDAGTVHRVRQLIAEGALVNVVKEVVLPAVDMPESCKSVAMFDTWSERTVVISTVIAVAS